MSPILIVPASVSDSSNREVTRPAFGLWNVDVWLIFRPHRVTKVLPRRVTLPERAAVNNWARRSLSQEVFDRRAAKFLMGRCNNSHLGIILNRPKACDGVAPHFSHLAASARPDITVR